MPGSIPEWHPEEENKALAARQGIGHIMNRITTKAAIVLIAAFCVVNAMRADGDNPSTLDIGFARYSLEDGYLRLFDIANPSNPLSVCHCDLRWMQPKAMKKDDGILRVEGQGGLAEFDILDIFAPLPKSLVASGDAQIPLPANRLPIAGLEAGTYIVCDGESAWVERQQIGKRREAKPFRDAPFFTATNAACGPVSAAVDPRGLILLACRRGGVQIFRHNANSSPQSATHCLTGGDALDIAILPGGFAVALGTSGYAIYDLDESGIVTLKRHYPLETGTAVSIAYQPAARLVAVDCEEGGIRCISMP